MDMEEYIETLKDPNAWFRQTFEQKYVADKILADVILNKDFIRSQKAKGDKGHQLGQNYHN